MSKLRIAPRFSIPDEAVTRSFGFLGMRGSGKSNAAVVIAEEMWKAGIPWVAIDVKGDWWGMKSSSDGEGPGLPVIVFGGEHQDVALEPTAAAGVEVAEAILGEGLTCILDLSDFTKGQKIEFLAGRGSREGFAERLFRRKRRETQEPLHMFMEETHDYVPQKATGDVGKMVEVVSRFQTMGRQKGIGCSVISLRSARIHKDVLSQIDTLFAFRTVAPHDRKAILEWVKGHGLAEDLVASLPELADGEAWLWSPEWLQDLKRFRWRRRETYDSGATPVRGKARRRPVTVADIDLKALEERMAAAVEKAKEQDPDHLRREIARLKKEMRSRPPETKVEEVVKTETVEVPVFKDGEVSRLEKVVGKLSDVGEQLVVVAREIGETGKEFGGIAKDVGEALVNAQKARPEPKRRSREARRTLRKGAVAGEGRVPSRPPRPSRKTERSEPPADEDFAPSGPQQRILDALAWLEGIGRTTADKRAAAFLSGASPKSSAFTNNLGALRTAGLIDYPRGGSVALTEAGRAVAQEPDIPVTPEGFQQAIYRKVSGPQARILRVLVEEYPNAIPKEDLAERSEASPTSSAFTNNLGFLRSTLGLIDYPEPGWVAAEPILFLEE